MASAHLPDDSDDSKAKFSDAGDSGNCQPISSEEVSAKQQQSWQLNATTAASIEQQPAHSNTGLLTNEPSSSNVPPTTKPQDNETAEDLMVSSCSTEAHASLLEPSASEDNTTAKNCSAIPENNNAQHEQTETPSRIERDTTEPKQLYNENQVLDESSMACGGSAPNTAAVAEAKGLDMALRSLNIGSAQSQIVQTGPVNIAAQQGQLILNPEYNVNQDHAHYHHTRKEYHSHTYHANTIVVSPSEAAKNGDDRAKGAAEQTYSIQAASSSNYQAIKVQTRAAIEHNQGLFVETESFRRALELVNKRRVLIITGPPLSGKSTTARAIVRHFRDEGNFEPLSLQRFEEWRNFAGAMKKKQILLLEHVFGDTKLDNVLLSAWASGSHFLRELAEQSDGLVHVIIVIRSHILEKINQKRKHMFQGIPVLDLGKACNIQETEKIDMIHRYCTTDPDETVSKAEQRDILACDRSGPMFPWCCAEYVSSFRQKAHGIEIFSHPEMAYVQSMSNLFDEKERKEEVITMFADMMIHIKSIEDRIGPNTSLTDGPEPELERMEENEVGFYVLHNAAMFSCRTLYDALGITLGKSLAKPELLRVCDTRFLVEHVHTEDKASLYSVVMKYESDDWKHFISKMFSEIVNGQLIEICQHPSMQNVDFLDLLEKHCEKYGCCTEVITTAIDEKNHLPLAYWSLWGELPTLQTWCLRYLLKDASKQSFPPLWMVKILLGSCLFGLDQRSQHRIAATIKTWPLFQSMTPNNRPGPLVFELPVPVEQQQFGKKVKASVIELQKECIFYPKKTSNPVPAELVRLEVTTDRVKVVSQCKTLYLAYRLMSDYDLDELDEAGKTLLQRAVEAEDLALVIFLIKQGASVLPSSGTSCFVTALQSGNRCIAECVFKEVANFAVLCGTVEDAYIVFQDISGENKTLCVDLLKQSDDICLNSKHTTMLHLAAQGNDTSAMRQLLGCNFDPNLIDEHGQTPLHIACRNANISMITLLLTKRANVNISDSKNQTPLHIACEEGDEQLVNTLLQHKAEIDSQKKVGVTPLYTACFYGHNEIVTTLLQRGASVNASDTDGYTPLHLACQEGHEQVVNTLLQHKADIDSATKVGVTPLHPACFNGHNEIVTTLLQRGASVNASNTDGYTPLHLACQEGHEQVVNTLLQHKADIDSATKVGVTPLHPACVNGHNEIVTTLLQRGASVNASDTDGYTPLHLACQEGHEQVVNTLLQHGADIDSATKVGETPLLFACLYGQHNIVTTLLQRGASVNASDTDGYTPLHAACGEGHEQVVNTLLQHKADIDSETKDGVTPLLVACFKGHNKIVTPLLQHGASVSASHVDGRTPLHAACGEGHEQVVNTLLQHKADIDSATKVGVTPLHQACSNGHNEIVTTLLQRGADVNASSKTGFTSLHFSCSKGHNDIVKILLQHCPDKDITACQKNREQTAKISLQHGVDVESVTCKGLTALHLACYNGHIDVVSTLLRNGVDLQASTKDGSSPLHVAMGGHELIVNTRLAQGANIEALDEDKDTPLHIACYRGFDQVIKSLLKNGANVKAVDIRGLTPLHMTCISDKQLCWSKCICLLITNGAQVNIGKYDEEVTSQAEVRCVHDDTVRGESKVPVSTTVKETPLHLAARYGYTERARALLAQGADVNAFDREHRTPIQLACGFGNLDTAKLLVDNNAQLGVPPHLHVIACFSGDPEIVRYVLQLQDGFNETDNDGTTPLHLAAFCGYADVVQSILRNSKRVQVNKVDKDGMTALHYASLNGHIEAVTLLLKHGSLVLKNKDRLEPKDLALLKRQMDIVRLLENAT